MVGARLDTTPPLRDLSRFERLAGLAAVALLAAFVFAMFMALVGLAELRGVERAAEAVFYWQCAALALLVVGAVAAGFFLLACARRARRKTLNALAAGREKAEQVRVQAAASDTARTRFFAVAGHDMRQPLHALALYLSALDRRVENPEARRILANMERATEALIAMLAALIDFGRLQTGAITPEVADFALQDVFERLAAENPDGAVEVQNTDLRLRSDPALIERALRHLISNARQHGGGRARLSAQAVGERVELAVADDGPGIAVADQARAFEEFIRLEGAGGEGLGLGLAIVRDIAQALETPLEVQSEPGRGARFILRPKRAPDGSPRSA